MISSCALSQTLPRNHRINRLASVSPVVLETPAVRAPSKRSGRMAVRNAILMPVDHGTEWRHSMEKPLLWQGTWKQAVNYGLSPALSPTWRVALLSDGSVTRHLQIMTGETVDTDCLDQVNIGWDLAGLPENVAVINGPRTQRELHLSVKGTALVCATSWWNTAEISAYLGQTQKPIWVNLSQNRTELYREITNVYCGHSKDLERRFGHKGPFWAREYIFWHKGQPLTLIHEIFSPALEEYLGPAALNKWCTVNSSSQCLPMGNSFNN